MFQKINKLIKQKTTNNEYKTYKQLLCLWEKNIDNKTKNNAELTDYHKGIITIKTKNQIWRTELTMRLSEIKKNFQQKKTTQ